MACFIQQLETKTILISAYGECSKDRKDLDGLRTVNSSYQTSKGYSFNGDQRESMLDVVLARCAIYGDDKRHFLTKSICVNHYEKLGPSWNYRKTTCALGDNIEGEDGRPHKLSARPHQISISESEAYWKKLKKHVLPGSKVCANCLAKVKETAEDFQQVKK